MDGPRALAVAVGAMAGAGTRWAALVWLGPGATDATLLGVNVLGCALLAALVAQPEGRLQPRVRALLGAGFCGTLTTWSALAVQTAGDIRAGDWTDALGWLGANLVLGIGAASVARVLSQAATAKGT